MAYEPLHHKYRPQTFGDLVGQEAIANTLINAIEQEKIATAYLFTGPRGTGKTSSARILAKSLNCLAVPNPTAKPCGTCAVCQAIAEGTALDVIEIDAASNTGVDNIREIIERAKFAPVQSRYKVYVIDECHMLSTAAFNALLKTLEEPPPQVVFILATTDPQRVLSTIISRCQRFDYRRIPLEEMIRHLEYIASREQIAIAKPAITLVAQIANGGLRDAESLLDQLSLFPQTITVEQVWDLVGAVPEQDLLGLLKAIRSNNLEHILEKCRNLLDRGREPLVVLQNLASFYLNLLIAKTSPQRNDLVAVTETCWQELQTEAVHWQISSLLQGQQKLKAAEVQLKNTTQPRLWLEVTLLGLVSQSYPAQEVIQETSKNLVVPPQKSFPKTTESQTTAPITPAAAVAQPKQSSPTEPTNKIKVEPITHSSTVTPRQPEQPIVTSKPITPISEIEAAPATAIPTPDLDPDLIWQKAIALLPRTTHALLSQQCHLVSIQGSMVIIGVVSPNLSKLIQAKIPNIETAFTQVCQRKIKVTLEVAKHKSKAATHHPASASGKPESNGSVQFSQPAREPIKAPENISAAPTPSPSPTISQPPTKPVVTQEIKRSPTANQLPPLNSRTSNTSAVTEPPNPVAKVVTPSSTQEDTTTPTEGDFQKAVEILAKSFDGEIIALENKEENLSPETTEISPAANIQANQEQLQQQPAQTIRNRPDLTIYEDEEDVPF